MRFDHERLDVYRAARAFVVHSERLLRELPTGYGHLSDQLRRAALSIVLNTAEGAGEFATAEKARFYRIAKRSATESAAVLDVMGDLELAERGGIESGLDQLVQVVSMLIKLAKVHSDKG